MTLPLVFLLVVSHSRSGNKMGTNVGWYVFLTSTIMSNLSLSMLPHLGIPYNLNTSLTLLHLISDCPSHINDGTSRQGMRNLVSRYSHGPPASTYHGDRPLTKPIWRARPLPPCSSKFTNSVRVHPRSRQVIGNEARSMFLSFKIYMYNDERGIKYGLVLHREGLDSENGRP